MVTREQAEAIAEEWIAAWNAHDVERVLSHYNDDFTMQSPKIAAVVGEVTGVLRGKQAIGTYWRKAMEMFPGLHFEKLGVYLLENLDEEQVLKIDREADVGNCSVTEYAFDPNAGRNGGLVLRRYNFVAPLEAKGAPVTAEPAKGKTLA